MGSGPSGNLRPILVFAHRWFGLLAALWLFLLGLTGSILVFYDEIDRALNRDLRHVEARGEMRPVADWIAAVQRARPEDKVTFLDLPNAPNESAGLNVVPREGPAPDYVVRVAVDPYTAEVLGVQRFGAVSLDRRDLMGFLYYFHIDLHLGDWMHWFLGLVALLWIVDHIAGAVLSFPSARKWRESFRIRKGARGHKLAFDIHRAGGLWLVPVTLTLAVSGIYFNWQEDFKSAAALIAPVTPRYDETAPLLAAPTEAAAVSIDAAIAVVAPARVDSVSFLPEKGLYWLRVFDPRDIDPYGRRWVYVDMTSGAVRADQHMAAGTASDQILAWQFALHSGKAFGWPGRIAIFVAGLAVCAFSVTGVMIWARKRRARIAARAKPLAGAPVAAE